MGGGCEREREGQDDDPSSHGDHLVSRRVQRSDHSVSNAFLPPFSGAYALDIDPPRDPCLIVRLDRARESRTTRLADDIGDSIRDVAKELRLDWHTVKALEQQYMREQLRRTGTPGPRVLGLDEVSINASDGLYASGSPPGARDGLRSAHVTRTGAPLVWAHDVK